MASKEDYEDYEVFEGPSFIMERHGRFMQSRSTLSPEEHAEMRRKMAESAPAIEADMAKRVQELLEILHRYTPEAMISSLWLRNSPIFADSHASSGGGETLSHGFVEYVATLYVRNRGDGQGSVVRPDVLEDVQSRVSGLFTSAMWLRMAKGASRSNGERDERLEELRFVTYMDSLFVRYPGFHQHLEAVLSGIHEEFGRDLRERLGWSLRDALGITKAVVGMFEERVNSALDEARSSLEEHRVSELSDDEQTRWQYGVSWWFQSQIQHWATFSVKDSAERSGVPVENAKAFVEAAVLPWDSCTEDYYLMPHPTPPISRRPILDLGDGRYFVPLPHALLWAVRPVVEDALKADTSDEGRAWWHRYETARADFSEKHAVALLSRALPHAGAFHSLKYPWVKDGQAIEAELDGLLIADDIALLVEVKSGEMSLPGRRGAPNGMTEDLKALVGEPHEQALRAREYLKSADQVDFLLPDNQGVTVDSGQLDDFIMITVTLDALDVFTATLYKLTDLGVVGEGNLPWAVSLLDLSVIVEAIEIPAQFIHFLRRRARLNELAFVMAHDELDWFGHYLSEGLWFEHLVKAPDDKEPPSIVNIIGYSENLDQYFVRVGRVDDDQTPSMPRQEMPADMRKLLLELEEAQHNGYLHISMALLDLGTEAREQLFKGMADAAGRTETDGRPHNFTLILDDNEGGLTFASDADRESLQAFLSGYCRLKMYQARCSEWVGMGRLVPSDHMLDEAVYIRLPWEFDEELEQACAEWFQPLPERSDGSPRAPSGVKPRINEDG